MKKVCIAAVCGVLGTLVLSISSAQAVPAFKKEFDTLYVKAAPSTDAEKSLAAAVSGVKCNLCHYGTSKKNRNDYGMALSKELTKDDAKNVEKIRTVLEKVASEKSKADDPSAPTFGQLIEQGKLPAEAPTATASAGN